MSSLRQPSPNIIASSPGTFCNAVFVHQDKPYYSAKCEDKSKNQNERNKVLLIFNQLILNNKNKKNKHLIESLKTNLWEIIENATYSKIQIYLVTIESLSSYKQLDYKKVSEKFKS